MFWAALAVMAVLTILSSFVLALIIFHTKRMKESESKFRLLFERVLSPIILINGNFRITAVNQASCALLGYTEEGLKELQFEELIPKEKWQRLYNEISKCLISGLDYHSEVSLVDRAGRLVQAEMSVTIHKANGSSFLLASFRDIGAFKRSEAAYKEKNAALNEVLAHIEEEKIKYRRQIADTIDQTITPVLSKLVKDDGSISQNHYKSLHENLAKLAAEAGGMLHMYENLTPRELEICNLIKSGATSKDIAESLNISILTVNKHRERIRRKLILVKKDVNLFTFLRKSGSAR